MGIQANHLVFSATSHWRRLGSNVSTIQSILHSLSLMERLYRYMLFVLENIAVQWVYTSKARMGQLQLPPPPLQLLCDHHHHYAVAWQQPLPKEKKEKHGYEIYMVKVA